MNKIRILFIFLTSISCYNIINNSDSYSISLETKIDFIQRTYQVLNWCNIKVPKKKQYFLKDFANCEEPVKDVDYFYLPIIIYSKNDCESACSIPKYKSDYTQLFWKGFNSEHDSIREKYYFIGDYNKKFHQCFLKETIYNKNFKQEESGLFFSEEMPNIEKQIYEIKDKDSYKTCKCVYELVFKIKSNESFMTNASANCKKYY